MSREARHEQEVADVIGKEYELMANALELGGAMNPTLQMMASTL
jgi:hypothetical protein